MDRLTYPDIARILGTGLISTGVGLLMFVLITILWGDPFTRLSAQGAQQTLERQFASFAPTETKLTNAGLEPELTRRLAFRARKTSPLGSPAGRIDIPKIKLHKVFLHGARAADLTKGPGLYRESPFPGAGRPIAIAGHRTTHGAPFLNVDKLEPGDTIRLTVPYGEFTYTVTRRQIITPKDWSILNFGAAERTSAGRASVLRTRRCTVTCEHLVLTACHPKYSAAKRMAIFARLSRVQLTAPGTRTAT